MLLQFLNFATSLGNILQSNDFLNLISKIFHVFRQKQYTCEVCFALKWSISSQMTSNQIIFNSTYQWSMILLPCKIWRKNNDSCSYRQRFFHSFCLWIIHPCKLLIFRAPIFWSNIAINLELILLGYFIFYLFKILQNLYFYLKAKFTNNLQMYDTQKWQFRTV